MDARYGWRAASEVVVLLQAHNASVTLYQSPLRLGQARPVFRNRIHTIEHDHAAVQQMQ